MATVNNYKVLNPSPGGTMPKGERRKRARGPLEMVGLSGREEYRLHRLSAGEITKEKQGLHLVKKLMCTYCGSRIQLDDVRYPSCKKRL
jgi:ABC-type nitrate/sulfonate/bicarbonate transport system ATPase subunit